MAIPLGSAGQPSGRRGSLDVRKSPPASRCNHISFYAYSVHQNNVGRQPSPRSEPSSVSPQCSETQTLREGSPRFRRGCVRSPYLHLHAGRHQPAQLRLRCLSINARPRGARLADKRRRDVLVARACEQKGGGQRPAKRERDRPELVEEQEPTLIAAVRLPAAPGPVRRVRVRVSRLLTQQPDPTTAAKKSSAAMVSAMSSQLVLSTGRWEASTRAAANLSYASMQVQTDVSRSTL